MKTTTLTLSGEKKLDTEVTEEHFHRIERSYGWFARTFALPPTVDASKVSAQYKAGVLTVRLPLREEAKPNKITVAVAASVIAERRVEEPRLFSARMFDSFEAKLLSRPDGGDPCSQLPATDPSLRISFEQAVRDVRNPNWAPIDSASARAFLSGPPMLSYWCEIAELDLNSVIDRARTLMAGCDAEQARPRLLR